MCRWNEELSALRASNETSTQNAEQSARRAQCALEALEALRALLLPGSRESFVRLRSVFGLCLYGLLLPLLPLLFPVSLNGFLNAILVRCTVHAILVRCICKVLHSTPNDLLRIDRYRSTRFSRKRCPRPIGRAADRL